MTPDSENVFFFNIDDCINKTAYHSELINYMKLIIWSRTYKSWAPIQKEPSKIKLMK